MSIVTRVFAVNKEARKAKGTVAASAQHNREPSQKRAHADS
jgi:hypothetical protein